jgi:uncharacterized protein YbaP (TraB family)
MILRLMFKRWIVLLVAAGAFGLRDGEAASCVWKVTSPNGGTLFLGGSIHALRSSDYPLPAAYNRALEASSRLVLEADPQALEAATRNFIAAGQYSKGDSLKNHVDPRTYQYVKHFFALQNVPEEKYSRFRPWMIDMMLESPSSENAQLGVEKYLMARALTSHKPIGGLETAQESVAPLVGLNDRQSEALLLIFFINLGRGDTGGFQKMVSAWRRGDVDSVAAQSRDAFRDFPAFGDRLVGTRNRRWIPKIEAYLNSGQTVFVVAGAAHFAGTDGVLALLRARGYRVEQL